MREAKIIIGANFGDEGKGLMTDYYAAEAVSQGKRCLNVCSNGGAQRGHTVRTPEGIRHVFHHFGSGTLAGADTWLPGYFILNPMLFMNEYEELIDQFNNMANADKINHAKNIPHIFLNIDSPVTTPYDMIINQIAEQHRGDARHGSCGVGIWETLVRNGACLGEVIEMNDNELRTYLERECRDYMMNRLHKLGIENISEEWGNIIYDPGLIENYIEDFKLMCSLAELRDSDVMAEYDRVIFENGQGLLLDRCRREYGCNTTPSNTGLRNPAELIREFTKKDKIDVEVCYVTRTYLTRHGAGRFEGECEKAEINPDMVDMTNVPNPYQGTIRYGRPDTKMLKRRIREDFDSEKFPAGCTAHMRLAVTHINEYESDLLEMADYKSDGETRDSIYRVI